jgi:hypothetical protein
MMPRIPRPGPGFHATMCPRTRRPAPPSLSSYWGELPCCHVSSNSRQALAPHHVSEHVGWLLHLYPPTRLAPASPCVLESVGWLLCLRPPAGQALVPPCVSEHVIGFRVATCPQTRGLASLVGIEDKSVHVYGLLHVITTQHSWSYSFL